MLHALNDLEALIASCSQGRSTDSERKLAARLVRFFDREARSHHQAEDKEVFPALLESSDVELVQHVRRLQQDHGWLEEDWRVISPQLDALSHGQSWVDEQLLAHQATLFAALYHEHIALEESIVYPAATRLGLGAKESAKARLAQWTVDPG